MKYASVNMGWLSGSMIMLKKEGRLFLPYIASEDDEHVAIRTKATNLHAMQCTPSSLTENIKMAQKAITVVKENFELKRVKGGRTESE